MKRKPFWPALFMGVLAAAAALFSQAWSTGKVRVMTLGMFHFDFPNLDVVKIDEGDQVDVLQDRYQREILRIVESLKEFKPTRIAVEVMSSRQEECDRRYESYRRGQTELGRSEVEQIGFRLARALDLPRLHCIDEWGTFTETIGHIIGDENHEVNKKMEAHLAQSPDSPKKYFKKPEFKTRGIIAELRELNREEAVRKDLGNYLIGLFKFEDKPGDFLGVDFETGRWFSRNLKIFRNIQRIGMDAGDRLLVLYGAGHLNLLNFFLDCSPEFERVSPLPYLR